MQILNYSASLTARQKLATLLVLLRGAPMSIKPRLLTGDTPTGKLHLGHYVGSVENRLALQNDYDCYFLIANKHAFTTRADRPDEIRQSVIDIATDYLAAGIDPNK